MSALVILCIVLVSLVTFIVVNVSRLDTYYRTKRTPRYNPFDNQLLTLGRLWDATLLFGGRSTVMLANRALDSYRCLNDDTRSVFNEMLDEEIRKTMSQAKASDERVATMLGHRVINYRLLKFRIGIES